MKRFLAVISASSLLFSSACDRNDPTIPTTTERPPRLSYAYARIEGSITIKEDPYTGVFAVTCPLGSTTGDVRSGAFSVLMRLEVETEQTLETCRFDLGQPITMTRSFDLLIAALVDSVKSSRIDIVVPPDTPQAVRMELPVKSVAVGKRHTCALSASNRVYCWGFNGVGQLGVGSRVSTPYPASVAFDGARQLVASSSWTCLIDASGTAYCWGDWQRTPKQVEKGVAMTTIISNGTRTCGRAVSGPLYCWFGNLGQQSIDPTAVPGLMGVTSIGIGPYHICALQSSPGVYCWGSNQMSQLGVMSSGPLARADTVVHSNASLSFTALTAGLSFTCALDVEGFASCWGRNDVGQLGRGVTEAPCRAEYNNPYTCPGTDIVPKHLAGDVRFQSIDAGYDHTCGVALNGALYCWGSGADGKLGNGSDQDSNRPVAVASGTGLRFTSVAAGDDHTCAVADGKVYCWGRGTSGELGSGDKKSQSIPRLVWGQE